MADGRFPTVVSRSRAVNAQTHGVWVQISDGTNAASVSAAGNLGVEELNSAAILADTAAMDTNLATIAGAVSGAEMQVDIVASLPAGTNNIGDVDIASALPAGSNNIGDVDVLSVIPGVGATNLGKAVDAVAGAADVGVVMLGVRDDTLSALTPIDGDYVRPRFTSTGALWVTLTSAANTDVIQDDSAFTPGTSYVGAAGYFADETAPDSVDEGDIGAARMTLDRCQIMVVADATTKSQRLAISSAGAASINLAQVLGATHSALNPVFVQIVSTAVSSDEIHDYDTGAAIASDASDNHDYTVTGTTFLLKAVDYACSGAMKVEIQAGPLASLTTRAVRFVSDTGGGGQIVFNPALEVPVTSTGTVRVIRTNRENQPLDVYSTIMGNDVA